MSDLDLWPRIEKAIFSTSMSRHDAEWQWPRCHKSKCSLDHGDIEFVFHHMAKAIAENIRIELLCKAITEPGDE